MIITCRHLRIVPLLGSPSQSYLPWDLSFKDRNSLAVQKRALLPLRNLESGLFWKGMCVSRSVVSDFLRSLWTVAHHAPLSMGFSRQDYWSGLSFSSPGDLPNPGLLNCRQILYHLSHQGSPKQKRPQCIDQESNWVSHVIGENSTTEPPMPLLKGFLKE